MSNLPLVLLCGGQSRRMGQDKALLNFHGESLLARQLRRAGARPCYVASAGRPYPLPPGVRPVADALPNHQGPLAAWVGALRALKADGCAQGLLLPIDTLITAPRLEEALWGPAPAPLVCIAGQPLFAWFSIDLLEILAAPLAKGERRLMPLLALPGTRTVPAPGDWPEPLNFNNPAQWQQILEYADEL